MQSASVDPRPQTSLNSAAETNGAAPTANESQLSLEKTRSMVAELNKTLEEVEGNYSVSVDNDTGLVVVRITDTETGDIIKQVPPEQVLEASVQSGQNYRVVSERSGLKCRMTLQAVVTA